MASSSVDSDIVRSTDTESDSEILHLKEKYGTDCRVISNIGEFVRVVTINFRQWDIKLKIQITGDYPSSSPAVVVSSGAGADSSESLTSDLHQFLQSNKQATVSVVKLVDVAHQWLSDKGHTTVFNTERPKSRTKKTKRSKVTRDDEEIANEKKPSMKTADDVINRIQWDNHVNQEDFTIGYIDRFLGLQEKSFTVFSWEDIASVDDFAALAIPRHRIQYFKYRGVVVWDKTKRIDNVFGSTGSKQTLSDVKEHLDSADSALRATENNSSQTRNVVDNDDDDDDDDDESSEFDSDSVISDDDDVIVSTNHVKSVSDGVGCLRKRPNHFICVRITNPDIIAKVEAMQSAISNIDSRFAKCFSNRLTLHMTICTLGLDTEYQVRNACQALRDCHSTLAEIARRNITFCVSGVDHFYARVVYAKIKQNVDLDEFVTRVRQAMIDAGVDIRDGYEFVPHLTILKLSKTLDSVVGANRLPPYTYQNFRNTDFGVQNISSIDLCAMTNERSDTGYYITPLHMELTSASEPTE